MNTKITKKRLSEMLQYDWIKILLVIVAAIVLWELLFTTTAVRLTEGQFFKVFYYQTLQSDGIDGMYRFMEDVDFSYDVLSKGVENLDEQYGKTILGLRLSVSEGDVIVVDNENKPHSAEDKKDNPLYNENSLYQVVDQYNMYGMEELLADAEGYLAGFKEGAALSDAKIEANFKRRMKKDNRFRKKADYDKGVAEEINRIKALDKEVADFRYLFDNYAADGLFFKYTKFQYTYYSAGNENYKEEYEKQEEKFYALNAGYLASRKVDGKKNISDIMSLPETGKADDVGVAVFNFKSKQPDLQYETIVFLNALVREYSNLLDGR